MLTSLSIKNYALIESLSVEFRDKLSIITGETGAGKSILLGALGLVLGKRADISTLKDASKKCIIEAQFFIENYNLETIFEENDIDFEAETIIRREILPSGKSRAFVNDTPTTLQVLNALSEQLIDVHSQYQTLQLSNVNFQFEILDAIGKNNQLLISYKSQLKEFNKLKKELALLLDSQEKAKEQYDYDLYLFEELSKANFKEGEQEELEQLLEKLNNIEAIKLNLSEAQELAQNEEIGLLQLLNKFSSNLNRISEFDPKYKVLFNRVLSVKIELDDIAAELEDLNEGLSYDVSEFDKSNDRLELIYNLQKKHQVSNIAELLVILESLDQKISLVQNSDELISRKQLEIDKASDQLDKTAFRIFKNREKSIPILTKKLELLLSNLGMENTRFKFELAHTANYHLNGKDELVLSISANKGLNFGELKKVASGGELSRIMLAVKAILSEYSKLPTIIFDEIDTGVSGEISQKMAEIMFKMSENMQVISITHLPQIASKGQHHYKVFKTDSSLGINTQLKMLSEEERIIEIAEMLGGKNITSTAIEHAKELLS